VIPVLIVEMISTLAIWVLGFLRALRNSSLNRIKTADMVPR